MRQRSSASRTANTTMRSVDRAALDDTLPNRYSEKHVDGPVGSVHSSSNLRPQMKNLDSVGWS